MFNQSYPVCEASLPVLTVKSTYILWLETWPVNFVVVVVTEIISFVIII